MRPALEGMHTARRIGPAVLGRTDGESSRPDLQSDRRPVPMADREIPGSGSTTYRRGRALRRRGGYRHIASRRRCWHSGRGSRRWGGGSYSSGDTTMNHRVSGRGRGRDRGQGRDDYYHHLVESADHRKETAATDGHGRGAGRRRSAAAAIAGGDVRRWRGELKAGSEFEVGTP